MADPAKSARKKLKKNLAKKETRKRKIDSIKPERKLKAFEDKNNDIGWAPDIFVK